MAGVSQKTRDRISRGTRWALAVKRQAAQVLPGELEALRRSGTLSASLRPAYKDAAEEGGRLVAGYEGDPASPGHRPMSEPRQALLRDFVRVGMLLRGELMRYGQTQDGDCASRALSAIGKRQALLRELGLEHREEEVPSLGDYIAHREAREDAAGDANADAPDAEPGGASGGAESADVEPEHDVTAPDESERKAGAAGEEVPNA